MNNQFTSTPYASLEPSVILAAIENLGYRCNGHLFALNSFENRVYQVGIEDASPIIAKFYRPHRWSDEAILEEHQFAAELMNQEIPVVAPLSVNDITLHVYQDFRFALFPRQSGRPFELDNLEHLEWMGRFIGRIHAVGACRPFKHRHQLNVETYGRQPYEFLLEKGWIPIELCANYKDVVENLLERITERFTYINPLNQLRLHGDFHAGNILWHGEGPFIVDLDDCLMGPAVQDIWMLISGGNEHDVKLQQRAILKGYRQFYDFNPQELHLIEALRTLRMIHYSAWLAKRWEDPAFPLNFPWFNTVRYWQEQLQYLREQWVLLQ